MKSRFLASAALAIGVMGACGGSLAASVSIPAPANSVISFIGTYTVQPSFLGDITGSLSAGSAVTLKGVALDGDIDNKQSAGSFSFTGLTAGSYDLYLYYAKPTSAITITGNVDFSTYVAGGGGTGTVPEPETYALALAGLMVTGLLARRRKTA